MSDSLIQFEKALDRLDNDKEIYISLVNDFIETDKNTIDKIETLILENNLQEAGKEAHRLKGCTLTLGAENLALICREIELSVKENRATKETLQEIFPSLKTTFLSTMDEFQKFLSSN